jgi:hypothetical protein
LQVQKFALKLLSQRINRFDLGQIIDSLQQPLTSCSSVVGMLVLGEGFDVVVVKLPFLRRRVCIYLVIGHVDIFVLALQLFRSSNDQWLPRNRAALLLVDRAESQVVLVAHVPILFI